MWNIKEEKWVLGLFFICIQNPAFFLLDQENIIILNVIKML